MFTYAHFIWLAISALIVVALYIISKKFSFSLNTVLSIMCIICIISEVTKILVTMIDGTNGGKVLNPESLPFHLCSIQIFFIFGIKFFIKSEKVKQTLYNFIVPTSLIGATISLFIPTAGVSFNVILVYQYFIYHAFLIFFALYLIREKIVVFTVKTLMVNYCLLLLLVLLNIWVNSFLSYAGTNFMFVTKPPIEGLPILNLNHGWFIYLLTLLILGVSLMGLFHLPFILIERKNRKIIGE